MRFWFSVTIHFPKMICFLSSEIQTTMDITPYNFSEPRTSHGEQVLGFPRPGGAK